MLIYGVMALMAVMTAGGVWCAERWLKQRPVALGCWFGFLAVIANTCSVTDVVELDIAVTLRDAPVIAAALFFGPVPGVIAGVIAAVERALTPLFGVGALTWCPLSSLLVALIASATAKWFLVGRRPYLVQAVVLGVVFEYLHLSFDVLLGVGQLQRSCEIVFSAYIPEPAAIAVAMGLSSVLLGTVIRLRELWTSSASRLLLVYIFVNAITLTIIMIGAEMDSRMMVESSVRRLNHLFESQLECLLHIDASWLSTKLCDPASRTRENIFKILNEEDFDELNLVGTDGKVQVSTGFTTPGFDFNSDADTRKYLCLLDGSRDFYCEPFRRSAGDTEGKELKYAAVRMPDGSGFLQMGFYRSRFEQNFKTFFFPIFNGVMNLFTSDYNIIASTNDFRIALANGGHGDFVGKKVDEIGLEPGHHHVCIGGEWCHFGEKQIGEWRIFTIVPLVESYGEPMVISAVLLLLFYAMIFGFRVVILHRRRQQDKIDALRAEVDRTRKHELETAAKIQQSCLPTELPDDECFRVLAEMCPAREVGGDFYDCCRLPDGRVVLLVADVSGKGVPAAMFMINAKSILKSSILGSSGFAEAIAAANDQLERNNEAEMFVTVWAGVYDPATGVVEYVNAGHNPPLVRRADGSVEWLRSRGGTALGVFSDCTYRLERVTLRRGDTLLLYTDGVTEAQDKHGGFYGEERLERLLGRPAADTVGAVFDDVESFAGGAEQADDITLFTLEVKA